MSVNELNEDSVSCPICSHNKVKSFNAHASDARSSYVKIRECKNCQFAWQYPRGRTSLESADWFEKAYADKNYARSDYFDEKRKREISQLEMGFVASLQPKGRMLLDIGAGAGIFAEVAAENGWSVTAVDPAINEDRFNESESIKVIKGSIEDILETDLFDVITLWDVIEHADKPVELIKNAKKYLRKNGWIIIETGNYKSADRIMKGESHWIYQLDHRWYFSPSSMEKLLSDCGFENITLSNTVLRPGWNGSVSYSGPSSVQLLKSILRNPFNLFKQISRYLMLLKAKRWAHSGIGIFAIAARKVS